MMTDGNVSFVMFNYDTLSWTTGCASGGAAATGLGGTMAEVTRKISFNSGQTNNILPTIVMIHVGFIIIKCLKGFFR